MSFVRRILAINNRIHPSNLKQIKNVQDEIHFNIIKCEKIIESYDDDIKKNNIKEVCNVTNEDSKLKN